MPSSAALITALMSMVSSPKASAGDRHEGALRAEKWARFEPSSRRSCALARVLANSDAVYASRYCYRNAALGKPPLSISPPPPPSPLVIPVSSDEDDDSDSEDGHQEKATAAETPKGGGGFFRPTVCLTPQPHYRPYFTSSSPSPPLLSPSSYHNRWRPTMMTQNGFRSRVSMLPPTPS